MKRSKESRETYESIDLLPDIISGVNEGGFVDHKYPLIPTMVTSIITNIQLFHDVARDLIVDGTDSSNK